MPSAAGSKATAFGGAAPPGVRTSLAGEFQAGQREFLGPIECSKAGGGDFLPKRLVPIGNQIPTY